METALKQLIKEAILEALVEFTSGGVATAADEPGQIIKPDTPEGDDATGGTTGGNTGGSGEDESGKGGGSADNSGGTPSGDGRPKPDVGVGVWSRR